MVRMRWLAVLGWAAIVGVAGAAGEPDELLQGKGLRKAGTYYVLPAEEDVARSAASVRGLQKKLVAAVLQQRAIDGQADANKRMIVEFTQQRRQMRQQLAQASTAAEHNQIVDAMNELGDRVNLLAQGREGDQQARKEAASAASERREGFVQALLEMGNLVEDAEKTYAKLAADPEVKAAIERLNQGAKPNAKVALGPTRTFQANVKALRKAQGSIQSEMIPLHEDNGTFEVDVTLNGKVTKAMTFDTGAALISLPAALAAKAGLSPTEYDPTIRLLMADGRVHEGKLMTLKSVRVGKFVVEDVECAVMPADLADAPPLLGGSFLKHFTYKLVPGASKLTLSKVATGEAPERPAARATRKKSAASKSEAP